MSYNPKRGYEPLKAGAAKWLLRSAEQGFLPAMVEAAHHLETTSHRRTDRLRAQRFYLAAARRGDANAAWALGVNAEAGFQRGARLKEAFSWFELAAKNQAGFGWKLGEYALAGIVTGHQARKALNYLKRAARNGESAEAEFYIGLRAYLGIGYAVDLREGMRWFARAASNPLGSSNECGEPCAHALLGRLLAFSAKTSRSGIHHLEIAANSGLPLADVDLALAFLVAGHQWAACAKLLRRAIQRYQGQWRRPGSVWLGIEGLTSQRIRLAIELLGQPAIHMENPFDELARAFAQQAP
jgi:hypothetical protein